MRLRDATSGNGATRLDWIKFRIALLGCLLGIALLGLWARAYYVQVVLGPGLSRQASGQYWTHKSTYGQRGKIFDARGNLLAKSVRINSVFARPSEIEKVGHTAETLQDILRKGNREIQSSLEKDRSFAWLARKISDRTASRIRAARLPGVYLTQEKARFYPQGHLAGQLLGFVGLDNEGLEGLECSYNQHLSGKKKEFIVQRDAGGRLLFAPGQLGNDLAGKDLVLTLDKKIQFAAEEALAGTVLKNRAKSGLCLVVKVSSGEILAWAQYPFFNPNNFSQSDPEIWKNRIALDVFEPGSTIKPILAAAALNTGTCRTQDIFFCENGSWTFSGQEIRDTHEYGWLPVNRIIRYSSNIGAGKIGLQLGAGNYHGYLSRLGLGQKTELQLPGEASGIFRDAGKWNQVDLIAASFGQGFGMTALQMAKMYLCLANYGELVPLRLLKAPQPRERASRVRVFSKQTAREVLSMMVEVVEEDGTGTQARIPGMYVGGKTGTAQKASKQGGYADRYTASFVGLFPGLAPEYLVLAVVDEPRESHYGGVVAAPAVREVARELVAGTDDFPGYWARQEQAGTGENSKQAALNTTREISRIKPRKQISLLPGKVPDVRGVPLRQALEVLAGQDLIPRMKGSGVLVSGQKPAPGTPWPQNEKDKLVLTLKFDDE
ncbi:MAG: PASTA domain-containing protein [Desulfohalobiaceae bacterium]|nr:PASTA domain-containing protein [Desulfohalobiaceae bacterium]